MNFKLELPEGTLMVNKSELKKAIQELLDDVKRDNSREDIMTIKETAEYLKVSVPTVRNMISDNEIPFFQKGQVIRLNRHDVIDWMRQNSKE